MAPPQAIQDRVAVSGDAAHASHERAVLALAVAQLRATADTLALLLGETSPSQAVDAQPLASALRTLTTVAATQVANTEPTEVEDAGGLADHLLKLQQRQR